MHYSHLFRVDTLTTPPKGVPAAEERWISSSTLREEEGSEPRSVGSTAAWSPPMNVLRTPIISAASGDRRSPTPNFLRESSPGASSPLTPLHYIRRASIEPGLSPSLIPTPGRDRERSPGLSSDGGGSVRGGTTTPGAVRPRPRVSASGTLARTQNAPPAAAAQRPRWR